MDYKLFDLVFKSADAMMRKLYKKHLEGWRGWDKDEVISDDQLIAKLRDNVDQKDWIDVMALAAMLNYRALNPSRQANPADVKSPCGYCLDPKIPGPFIFCRVCGRYIGNADYGASGERPVSQTIGYMNAIKGSYGHREGKKT